MNHTHKTWTRLGLGSAVASAALLTACQPQATDAPVEAAPAATTETTTTPAAPAEATELASQSGEGEGGVAIEAAATDPVVFNAALAITEAHILAARDAYAEGEVEAAAEMFAHPVSEVLFDMEPIFETLGVPLFDNLLTETSAASLAGESPEQIAARTDTIIDALRRSAAYAPEDGRTPAEITAAVISDQIDRASVMYRIAASGVEYEPYLDGYGFYVVARNMFADAESAILAADPEAAAAISQALDLMADAYPTATRPDALDKDISAITVAASNVILAVSN